jgi:hypothetical protein
MAINNSKLLSGAAPVVPYDELTASRYEFVTLGQTEPSLGAGAANSVLTLGVSNTRVWSNSLTLTSVTVTGNISAGNVLVGNIVLASTGNISLGNGWINNLANPVNAQDAATKFYVDQEVGNVLPIISNQQITPDGTSNTFALNQSSTTVGVLVTVNGVTQSPNVSYTVSGNSISFSQVPLTGDIIQVRFLTGGISGGGIVAVTIPVPLASLTATAGARAFVNNGNLSAAGNFGAQIGGGGSNTVPVWSDGVNWYIG